MSGAIEMKRVPEGWRVRLRHGGGKREYFVIPAPQSETDDTRAQGIAAALQRMANHLSQAGRDPSEIKEYLEDAAGDSGDRVAFSRYEKRAGAVVASPKSGAPTFREVAARWLSGELHRLHRDEVQPLKPKTHAKYSSCLVLINRLIGDKAVDKITLEDAEAVKAAIPEARTQSTRRAYALVTRKVLSLSEYPLKHIDKSPIPKSFVPPQGKSPVFGFLYPSEEARLLRWLSAHGRHSEELDNAVIYGTLHREGMRESEAAMLTVSDLDFESGEITLDENKTDDPRTWAMGHDVAIALKIYIGGAGPDDLVFPNFVARHAAEKFRGYIQKAGITRKELTARGPNRRPIRLHDSRSSFITMALAIGMTEAWVTDRTGHKSSAMVHKYQRQMRHIKTLGLSWFSPLHECLGYGTAATLTPGPRVAHVFTAQPNLAGHEPRAENPQFTAQGTAEALEAEKQPSRDPQGGPMEPSGPAENRGVAHEGSRVAHGPRVGAEVVPPEPVDPVEKALADAIEGATQDKRWDVVLAVTRELEQRRLARAASNVTSLDSRRKPKGEGK
jgi:integrase